jgi:acyl-coenzyme A synthetase/AMP-(fatty) acid ligase
MLKKDTKASPEDLQEFVASKVASFKKIEEVVLVDSIPKNTTGKILRRELKKMYA